jgi:hypothetical protein
MQTWSGSEKRPQDEHVKRSLEEPDPLLSLLRYRRHSTLDLATMVDTRLSIVKGRSRVWVLEWRLHANALLTDKRNRASLLSSGWIVGHTVAVAMAFGPAAGLELVDPLTAERSLQNYHLLPSVRGDLLKELSRFDEARAELSARRR